MSLVRRLDHVAIAVTDTNRAVDELRDRLGLEVSSSEELARPPVRLTYLDAGNCFIQLVEPLDHSTEVARWLEEHGQGIHHVCFGVDSVSAAIAAISGGPAPSQLGSGRGRPAGFVPYAVAGMRVECTEFSRQEDVDAAPGWLGG